LGVCFHGVCFQMFFVARHEHYPLGWISSNSTLQSQNDMNGRNDASDNTHHCRDCVSLHYGCSSTATAGHV